MFDVGPKRLCLFAGLACLVSGLSQLDGQNPLSSIARADSDASAIAATWRSSLYPTDWSPGYQNQDGLGIHDFSYAGYHNGEKAIGNDLPDLNLDVVRSFGADPSGLVDSTTAIQNAIDYAADEGGGVVYIPEGIYRLDGTLTVDTSHIIIQGEGPDKTKIYFTKNQGMSYKGHITFKGALSGGNEVGLARDGAPFETHIDVEDASDYAVGDDISIGWVITPEFIEEHQMTGTWEAFNDTWQPFFWREIVDIDTSTTPHRVWVDVPLRYPAKVRDDASIRKYTGYLEEVGIEHLSLSNVVDYESAWEEIQVRLLEMHAIKDGWVRNVHSFKSPLAPTSGHGKNAHLQGSGVMVKLSKRVTVAQSQMGEAQNRGEGGCGYLFEIRQSSEILTTQCKASGGRHNFIQNWGFGTTGCVWHQVESEKGRAVSYQEANIGKLGFSEFHHSLATANLIDDSVFNDGWQIENRKHWSSGAGHTGTETVIWNVAGRGIVKSLQYGYGYVIGTGSKVKLRTNPRDINGIYTAPEDFVEGEGEGASLEPQSLYLDQLERRLSP